MTVKEFLQLIESGNLAKAAILTSAGGQLSPENAERFINAVRDQNSVFKANEVEIIPMKASTKNIDVIGLASRVMRGIQEGTAPSDVVGVSIARRTLVTKEVILPYDVSYSFLEENIEGQDVDAVLNSMFATQFGNDLLDLGVNGDESSQDEFIKINNGWLKLVAGDAAAHEFVGSAGDEGKVKDVIFPGLMAALPNKWKGDPNLLSFYVSPSVEEAYRGELGERATALGDAFLTEYKRARYKGIEVVPLAYMPDSVVVLTLKRNFKVGIGRQISYERQLQPRKRIIEYTITAKSDFNYALSDAIAFTNTASWS